jgi:hypothetical protein
MCHGKRARGHLSRKKRKGPSPMANGQWDYLPRQKSKGPSVIAKGQGAHLPGTTVGDA